MWYIAEYIFLTESSNYIVNNTVGWKLVGLE